MKHFIFITFFTFLMINTAEAQTNANISGPENVLVVWNGNSTVSDSVQQYYVQQRNIPPVTNVLRLDNLVSHNITVDGSTHKVIIAEGGNIIRDSINHINGTWYASRHAWKYFYQYLALPIKEHLINNNLVGTIKYIALVKGVPFYIQSACDSTNVIANLAVDGLLAMLGTNNYDILLDSIYSKYRSYAVPNYHIWNYWQQMQITNPYYTGSPCLNMDNRFNGGVFTESWNGNTIKFDYLVSHLDGISYNIIEGMINKSVSAINSENYDWFIDADPYPCHGESIMVDFANSTASNLSSVGFTNYSFNTTEDTVTFHNKPIMSYSSNGVHTTKPPNIYEGQTMHPDYIQSQLNFNYPAGAIFNSAESYNAWRISSITRASAPMGQIVEFFLKGGTVGVGHANEPFTDGIIRDGVMFPAYQVGYSFIDAAYMGMPYLAWQNVVVGDPLTTIAWGKQTLTENKTLSGTNLVTGVITVPSGKTLTIAANAVINFKHSGSLIVNGNLTIGHDAVLNFYNGSAIVVNGTLIIEDNLTIPSGAALTLKLGSVFNFGNSLTIDGTLNLEDVITLPVGSTLTFNQEANATFTEYASLIVNGTLIASGATFDLAPGESHNWGSILFDGYETSSSILDNVVINNATNIQIVNNANVTIQNSTIQDCTQGFYVYNASPRILNNQITNPLLHGIYVNASTNSLLILDNTITKISSNPNYKHQEGIILYGGTIGNIAHNDISGFDHGVYVGSSNAYFTDDNLQNFYPNNRFTGNRYGVMVGWGSYLLGGYDLTICWNNNISYNDYYNIYVYQSSTAWAQYNYWGSGNLKQYADGSSHLYATPILYNNPWAQSLAVVKTEIPVVQLSTMRSNSISDAEMLSNQNQTTALTNDLGAIKDEDELMKGILLAQEGKIDEAIDYLKQLVKNKKYGLYAITELAGLKERYAKENVQTYFEDLLKDPNAENISRIKKALAGFYLSNNEDDRALAIYDELKDDKISKQDNFDGLYEKFNVMLHKKKDFVLAKTLLAELKNKFADDADAMIHITTAEVLMSGKNNFALGKKQSEPEVTTKVEAPKEYALFNNYPNPFNPATTITYQLPKSGSVTLKIYDMLGNEVKTLVNEQKEMGRYTVQFDASSLASGMYVYQLRVNDYTSTKKMLLLK